MPKLVVLFATLTAVYVNGAVVPPVTNVQGNSIVQQINGLALQVQKLANDVTTSILNALPDNKQITDSLITQIQQFSQNVVGIIGNIQTQVNSTQANLNTLLKQTTANLNNILISLQSLVGIGSRTKVSDIGAQISNSLKNATSEIQNLAKAVQPELQGSGKTLQNFAKGIVDDFVKAVDNIKTQMNALPSIGRK